jgi:hypothetical protein
VERSGVCEGILTDFSCLTADGTGVLAKTEYVTYTLVKSGLFLAQNHVSCVMGRMLTAVESTGKRAGTNKPKSHPNSARFQMGD